MKLLWWAILVALMLSLCCPTCPEQFQAKAYSTSLSRHQNGCAAYKAHVEAQHMRIRDRTSQPKQKKRRIQESPEPIAGPSSGGSAANMPDPTPMDLDPPSPSPSPPPPPPLPPPPKLTAAGRPARNYRLPKRFQQPEQVIPEQPAPIVVVEPPAEIPFVPRVAAHVRDTIISTLNSFRVFREYTHRPSHDPDASITAEELANFPVDDERAAAYAEHETTSEQPPPPWPFANMTTYNFMTWLNTGSNLKSEGEAKRLIDEVISDPSFVPEHLIGINPSHENRKLDEALSSLKAPWNRDGWHESTVQIEIPSGIKARPPHVFDIPGLHHRSLVEVIKTAFSDPLSQKFHLTPFKRLYKTVSGATKRIYDELYTSNAWIKAHDDLQQQPPEPGCKLERVIAGLMFWSDSTHLADFGSASAWPIYMYFGNLSKYIRAQPTSGACHHMAYIPSLPDSLTDLLSTFTSKSYRKKVKTHCKRELMHQIWRLMLDDDFKHAYEHGIVVKCFDGIFRRIFPRIFTYSADYPEKVLLATIRDNGFCLCPRCFMKKDKLHEMGMARDLRSRITGLRTYFWTRVQVCRKAIYQTGLGIASPWVEALLQPLSLVPTYNAFSELLRPYEAEMFPMLAVDLMHEFELGVWKAVFTHLIRILYSVPGDKVSKFDERFRQVPSFGVDIIRRVNSNVSERKKLAARNYEDYLQTIIPVIKGLLPEPFNSAVMTMLFRLAEWHALAKLRMHTEDTLSRFETSTKIIGSELRKFRDTSAKNFKTKELPGEASARARRSGAGTTQQSKYLNLNTYKLHALGDYPLTVYFFGTTDSFSTQIGELAHRLLKRLYRRTNKNRATKQITKLESRHRRLKKARQAADSPRHRHAHHVPFSAKGPREFSSVDVHHHISPSRNCRLHLRSFVDDDTNDPAKLDFILKLKNHLLHRLLNGSVNAEENTFSDADRATIKILGSNIYCVGTLRVSFTTYDMRRGQDVVNPRTHGDVMLLSDDTRSGAHPFCYARVLGVFHAEVLHTGTHARSNAAQRMEFLWVRWFSVVPGHKSGFKLARLPKIRFTPWSEDDNSAFGFLDPSLVLRGCHLIPAFADGRTSDLLRTSSATAARQLGELNDWANFYVTIWVDRDMFMRYLGGGVGHVAQESSLPTDDLDLNEPVDGMQEQADPEPLPEQDSDDRATSPPLPPASAQEPGQFGGDSDDEEEGEGDGENEEDLPDDSDSSDDSDGEEDQDSDMEDDGFAEL